MRKLALHVALAGALALFSAPVQAASQIGCMDTGYSDEENRVIGGFLSGFTVANMNAAMSEDGLVRVIANRARTCARENSWELPAIKQSIFYRMSGLLLQALERHPPMTRAQMRQMQASFASADQAELRRVLGPKLDAELSGNEAPEPSGEESTFLGMIIVRSGIPLTTKNSEYAGSWIGAKMMRDMAAERFAALN